MSRRVADRQQSTPAGRAWRWLLAMFWLAGMSPAAVADTAPLFAATLSDLDGKPVALETYRGKPLIVNFWARWCGPCRVEIPELARVQTAYRSRGLVVLGIGVEENAESARDFAKAYDMHYPVVIGDNRKTLWLMQVLGNKRGGLPFTAVIGRDGRLVSHKLGIMSAAELESAAAELLRP